MSSNAKSRLVDFLDRKAFDPVLRADAATYPESKRSQLERVQRATESEKGRYHKYGSADEVYRMFRDDLSSEPARRVHRELRDLHLPTLDDVRGEFETLASELEVGR